MVFPFRSKFGDTIDDVNEQVDIPLVGVYISKQKFRRYTQNMSLLFAFQKRKIRGTKKGFYISEFQVIN